MKLFIEQHILTWGAQFAVYDEAGNQQYFVKGKPFSMDQELHVFDRTGHQMIVIRRELFSWPSVYNISIHGHDPIQLTKELTVMRHQYRLDAVNWDIKGNFLGYKYGIYRDEQRIASLEKDWGDWVDYYALDYTAPADELMALAVVLAIDCDRARRG